MVETTFYELLIALDEKKITVHDIEWPEYILDLNPWDIFLWSYIKDKIYRNPPDSLEDMKSAIRSEIDAFDSNALQRIMTQFWNRLYTIVVGALA